MKHYPQIKWKATIAMEFEREETHMNKHSDIQNSDTQGHTINIVPSNREITVNKQ